VQLVQEAAASAGVRRREFLKSSAALYLASLGSAAHSLVPGADAKRTRSKEKTIEIKKAGCKHPPKAPRIGLRELFASTLYLQLRTPRWLPVRVSLLSRARGLHGTRTPSARR